MKRKFRERIYIYQLSNLSFAYEKEASIFLNMNLNIPYQGLTLITGGNGSGKTTLCRLLTGLTEGYQGSLALDGKELSSIDRSLILERIIYIKQDMQGNLLGITPDDDLQIWQNRFSEPDTAKKVTERKKALNILGIKDLCQKPLWELSYGQKRRTMLSVLPLFMDRYWIIDEPTASLDQESIELLTRLIRKKCADFCGALILTHRPYLFSSQTVCEPCSDNNLPGHSPETGASDSAGDYYILSGDKIIKQE